MRMLAMFSGVSLMEMYFLIREERYFMRMKGEKIKC
jgi:hypothetical protein